jgi:hypothetical protein
MVSEDSDITGLLRRWTEGSTAAENQLFRNLRTSQRMWQDARHW